MRVPILLLAASLAPSWGFQLSAAEEAPRTIFGVSPTVGQFKDEIRRADAVVRARVKKVYFHRAGNHADEDVIVHVVKSYKGRLFDEYPCVRVENECLAHTEPSQART